MSIAGELRVLADNLAEVSVNVRRLAREFERHNPEPVEPWHGQATSSEGPFRRRSS